ncbi:hypothetical protein KSS87_009971, partial [Heliosperma pusillum]
STYGWIYGETVCLAFGVRVHRNDYDVLPQKWKFNSQGLQLVSFAVMEESPLYVPLHLSEEPPKQEVRCIGLDQSPCDRVQQAVECLPSISDRNSSEIEHCFRHWTIMDYSNAYNSGAVTPREVAEQFIRAVEKSSSPECNMCFFINLDAKDIMQQATESTHRYVNGGTTWLHKYRSCKRDATCVDRLRSCGAILVGKANMQELGAGLTGINPHYGATRNPYNTSRITGGSSSGSAAVVCAGLCPVALGVDGGGSVRMPAALCGVVGLKPTFRRIPHAGVLPLNWTVGMVGILAGTVEDALITYAAIGGESASDPSTVLPPEVKLPILKSKEISGDIKMANGLMTVTLTSNVAAQMLSISSRSGTDGRMTATPIQDDALETGELDYVTGAGLVRYQIAGNFLGLPAITLPIGYDKAGLPIGLQFIGRPWSEATLLHIAFALQDVCMSEYRKPAVYYDLLNSK